MKNRLRVTTALLAAAAGVMLSAPTFGATAMSDTIVGSTKAHVPFGKTAAGVPVDLYTLRNKQGMEVHITNYGGIITSLTAPDRKGQYADVVLGYDSLAEYEKGKSYFGALIGRYGNRIAKGRFALDGTTYQLATNDGPNTLHGGVVGFNKVVWTVTQSSPGKLALSYISKDGEEGYPGTLKVDAVYTLTDDNALRLDFTASTDKDTPVNLTQHSYFNLRGAGPHGPGTILNNQLQIPAGRFTPVDATLIPTGQLQPVAGTPFDFREPTAIGARIDTKGDEQLKNGKGYDHNWVLDKGAGVFGLVARVYEPDSGRVLEVSSTEPGVQFYSGNFLDGNVKGKGGWAYGYREGLALEPQHFPDSPNRTNFPSTILRPGQTYRNTILYQFTTR
jgi:aldose 1-epimerase